jgi:hypothetical protein
MENEIDHESFTSENLSKMSRSIFIKAEKGNVDRRDMVKINGVTSYDDASCFSWVYECVLSLQLFYMGERADDFPLQNIKTFRFQL